MRSLLLWLLVCIVMIVSLVQAQDDSVQCDPEVLSDNESLPCELKMYEQSFVRLRIDGSELGTGFIISESGHILTAGHVVARGIAGSNTDPMDVKVEVQLDGTVFDGQLQYLSSDIDFAVLKIINAEEPLIPVPAMQFAYPRDMLNRQFYALGYPGTTPWGQSRFDFPRGEVLGEPTTEVTKDSDESFTVFRIGLMGGSLSSGMSGSPLIMHDGDRKTGTTIGIILATGTGNRALPLWETCGNLPGFEMSTDTTVEQCMSFLIELREDYANSNPVPGLPIETPEPATATATMAATPATPTVTAIDDPEIPALTETEFIKLSYSNSWLAIQISAGNQYERIDDLRFVPEAGSIRSIVTDFGLPANGADLNGRCFVYYVNPSEQLAASGCSSIVLLRVELNDVFWTNLPMRVLDGNNQSLGICLMNTENTCTVP